MKKLDPEAVETLLEKTRPWSIWMASGTVRQIDSVTRLPDGTIKSIQFSIFGCNGTGEMNGTGWKESLENRVAKLLVENPFAT